LNVLDGYGNVLYTIPSASIGQGLITNDVTSSMTVATASYSLTQSYVIITSSSYASSSLSSSYSLTSSYNQSSSYSLNSTNTVYADTASFVYYVEYSGTSSISADSISSSYALTASYALNGGSGGTSLTTGSFYPITSSWALSASWAPGSTPPLSSSYASTSSWSNHSLTASYVEGIQIGTKIRSGIATSLDFSGIPLKATVILNTPFTGDQYSVTINGEDPRTWTYESKTSSSFVINSNSNVLITGEVGWQTIYTDVDVEDTLFRAGLVSGSLFTGIPSKYTVTLTKPLFTTNYAVMIGSEEPRTWTYSNRTNSSFVINSNSNVGLTEMVSWQIIV
jgi:hypothetical protein